MSNSSKPYISPYTAQLVRELAAGRAVLPGGEDLDTQWNEALRQADAISPDAVLFRYIIFTYIARAVTLAERGELPAAHADELAKAILALRGEGPPSASEAPDDIFEHTYHRLLALGAPKLTAFEISTTREYLQATVFRMAARDELFDLLEWIALLNVGLAALAQNSGSAALPAFSQQSDRNFEYLMQAFAVANTGAAGKDADNANRARLCELVAFDAFLPDCLDSLSATDYMTVSAGALASAAVDVRRFVRALSLLAPADSRGTADRLLPRLALVISDCTAVLSLAAEAPCDSSPGEPVQKRLWAASRNLTACLRLLACGVSGMRLPTGDACGAWADMLNLANERLGWWEGRKNELLGKRDSLLAAFGELYSAENS